MAGAVAVHLRAEVVLHSNLGWDGSCWHCKSKDHKRDGCSAYKRLCDSNGGKAPSSYVSEYTKAKTAWDKKHKVGAENKGKRATHLKVHEEEAGNNTEGEDDSDSGTEDEFDMAMVIQSSKR